MASVRRTGLDPPDDCSTLAPVRWLLGEWISRGEQRVTTETWREASTETFEGIVTSQSGDNGEVSLVETLRLAVMSGRVFYFAKVPEHARPVSFTMTACDERTAVFENPDHDFPKKIEYRLGADGDLSVDVTDGAVGGFRLRYTRASEGDSRDA
jgi:hypothetical protein